jgi:hypothetical protein
MDAWNRDNGNPDWISGRYRDGADSYVGRIDRGVSEGIEYGCD